MLGMLVNSLGFRRGGGVEGRERLCVSNAFRCVYPSGCLSRARAARVRVFVLADLRFALACPAQHKIGFLTVTVCIVVMCLSSIP